MIVLLALHALCGVTVVAFGARWGRRGLLLAAVPSVVSLGWFLASAQGVLDGVAVAEKVSWVPALGLDVDLRLDGFSLLFALLISGIGVLVFWYSRWYFGATGPGLGRLIGLLTLFSGSMLGLVVADNLFVLYGFWELTSITSYLLIGNKNEDARARASALHALLVTGAGGLAMLLGFVVIGQRAGTVRLSELVADPPSGRAVEVALVLVLLGAATKSAQYPFHSWLPGAMVAPTPVSAYLHSATMVKAGVYLVARFSPAFAEVGVWRTAVVGIGLVTMIGGGLRALRQRDLKLLLAFGTVSQLGLLVVLFGVGTDATVVAGCTMLVVHAFFKAGLFMGVGILDHQLGTRDVHELPRLPATWRPFAIVFAFTAAVMAAIPLTAGFIAKEEAYSSVAESSFGGPVTLAGVVLGSMLTFAYSARLVWGVLRAPVERGAAPAAPATRPSWWFLLPPGVLGVGLFIEAALPALISGPLTAASASLVPGTIEVDLAMWHGVNLALGLSVATIVGGALLYLARNQVATVLATGSAVPSALGGYRVIVRSLNTLADRVTGVVQNGSLPVYAGVVLLTAVALPATALVRASFDVDSFTVVDEPAEVLIVGVLIGSALAAAIIRRRFAAALFLGVTGYGMAGLFVLIGAPDLALTQTAIETLTTVLFVLVLRRLPDRFERRSSWPIRVLRAAVATSVGVVVFAFALLAGSERIGPPVSDEMTARAYPEGQGRNVVNVILVDIRGFDTMGEITVLAAAAIGATALARAGRPPRDPQKLQEHAGGEGP